MNDVSDHNCFKDTLSNSLSNSRKQDTSLDSSLQSFPPHLWRYKELQTLSLQVLPHIQKIFSEESQIHPELCDQAFYDLKDMATLLKEQTTLLNEILPDYQENKLALSSYQLKVILYYTDELLTQVQSLFIQIRSLYRSKSRQVLHLREELLYKLALVTKNMNDIVQEMQVLSDQTRFQKRSIRHVNDQIAFK